MPMLRFDRVSRLLGPLWVTETDADDTDRSWRSGRRDRPGVRRTR